MAFVTLKRSIDRARCSRVSLVAVLMVLTLALRAWDLSHIPSWLWFDEAGNGLDARELLHGQFRLFFPRSLGKEPLFNYLITPFVAAWDSTSLAVRLPAGLVGTLMIPVLYAAGRALWPEDRRSGIITGLTAAAFWAVNYWPQSINRISFRANTLPLVLTLAVTAWLIWIQRPDRRRAATFGGLAALTLYTYLAARASLLLWPLLYLALPAAKRRRLQPTIIWAVVAFALAVAPLAGYFVFHPEDLFQRMGTVTVLVGADSLGEKAIVGLESLARVLGGFLGLTGDQLPRHNLPDRPPFLWPLAGLFVVGLSMSLANLVRSRLRATERCARDTYRLQRSWTLLLWWSLMILPGVLAAENNPHFLRLFGALPAALLIAAMPLTWTVDRLQNSNPVLRWTPPVLLIGFIVTNGINTAQAYFVNWARNTDLYDAYQGDIWTYGAQVHDEPAVVGVVSRSPYFYILDYAFKPTRFLQVSVAEEELEAELARIATTVRGMRVAVPAWRDGLLVDTDPKEALPFYLAREGTLLSRESFRNFDLLSFQMGPEPQFSVAGRRQTPNAAFSNGFRLLEARWGPAYPNPVRDGETAWAGTAIWAVLTWQSPPRASALLPDLKAALDLVDEVGHRLASDERLLLDAKHLPVSKWNQETLACSYHLVAIPATQLPGPLQLKARLYEAESLTPVRSQGPDANVAVTLASVNVQPNPRPVSVETLPLRARLDVRAASGVTLLGLAPWPDSVAPGQTLPLRAYWRIEAISPAQVFTFTLDEGAAQATARLPGNLPPGSIVHTDLDLRLRPEIATGAYPLRLGKIQLGEVNVAGRPRRFDVPDLWLSARAVYGETITLLGANAAEEAQAGRGTVRVAAGQTLTLALVWRAERTAERDLTRFAHLVGPDGRPVTQEDIVPCQGACPATSWVPAEILIDQVTLPIPADLAPGSYSLAIGWYDPTTLIRLPARDETGEALPDDMFRLLIVEVTP